MIGKEVTLAHPLKAAQARNDGLNAAAAPPKTVQSVTSPNAPQALMAFFVRAWNLALRFRYLLVTVVGAVLGWRTLLHPNEFNPVDLYRYFLPAGREIFAGHLAKVFASSGVQAGPLELIWQAGWVRLGHALALPGTALLGAASGAGLAVLGTYVAGVLAARSSPEVTRRARARAELVAGLLAAVGLLSLAVSSGHPAEVVIPCLWMLAVAVVPRRPVLAGLLIGLGSGWEVWSVLGAVLLGAAPWRRALRGVAATALLSLAWFAPFIAAGPFRMLAHRWAVMPDTLFGTLMPSVTPATWWMRFLQAALVLAAGAVVLWRYRAQPHLAWAAPLVLAVVRLLTDPLDIYYYWLELRMPLTVAVAVLVGTGAWRSARWRAGPTALVIAVVLCWLSPNAAIAVTVELLVLIALAVAALCACYLVPPVTGAPSGTASSALRARNREGTKGTTPRS